MQLRVKLLLKSLKTDCAISVCHGSTRQRNSDKPSGLVGRQSAGPVRSVPARTPAAGGAVGCGCGGRGYSEVPAATPAAVGSRGTSAGDGGTAATSDWRAVGCARRAGSAGSQFTSGVRYTGEDAAAVGG